MLTTNQVNLKKLKDKMEDNIQELRELLKELQGSELFSETDAIRQFFNEQMTAYNRFSNDDPLPLEPELNMELGIDDLIKKYINLYISGNACATLTKIIKEVHNALTESSQLVVNSSALIGLRYQNTSDYFSKPQTPFQGSIATLSVKYVEYYEKCRTLEVAIQAEKEGNQTSVEDLGSSSSSSINKR